MTDILGISTRLESKTEQCYSVQKILESIVLPFFEEQLNKNESKKSNSDAKVDVGRSIDNESNSLLKDIEIDCRIVTNDDLSVSLSKLQIADKVHLDKVNGKNTNSPGNEGGMQVNDSNTFEVIPRGKECKAKSGTKPYDRDMRNADAYSNYLPTLPLQATYFGNNPGQTCNILKHEDGFSGGTVMIRSSLNTAPQVISLKHFSEDYHSNNYFDPDLSGNTPEYPSFLNTPQSIGQISSGVDDDDSNLGETLFQEISLVTSCIGDDVCSISIGGNTPPYDPLNDIIVRKNENGEFGLFVINDDDDSIINEKMSPGFNRFLPRPEIETPKEMMFQRYLKLVTRTEIKTPDKDINAYRMVAALSEEMLTKSDENGNTLITDVVLKCNPSIFKAVLERYKRSGLLSKFIDKKNKSNRTPLHYAVHLCDAQKVRLLVEMGADVNIPVITRETKWKTESLIDHVISEARSKSNTSLPILIELLCSPKADLMHFGSKGCTPLHTAILCQDMPLNISKGIIYHLIMRGSDINMQDSFSRTPLSCAVEHGHHLVSHLFQAIKTAYPDNHQSKIKSLLQPGIKFLKMAFELHNSDPIAMVKLINLLLEHGAELTKKSSDSDLRKELLRFPGIEMKLLTKDCK